MSKKRDKESSLSEKLTSLIQPKPALIESDDDDIATADKITPAENESDFSADELDVPNLRKLNNQLLEEEDEKYSGKKVLRKALDDFSKNDESDIEDDDDDNEGLESVDEESEIESGTGDEDVGFKKDNEKFTFNKKPKVEEIINKEIFSKASEDIEKGKGIKNQLHIWDFLLDCRVRFQKCLLASNQFPNYKNLPSFQNQGGQEFQSSVVQCKKSLKHLLNSLLTLQTTLLNLNKDFLSTDNKEKKGELDDEILSSDDEINDNVTISNNCHKIKKIGDFSAEINRQHENFKTYRNSTIQKWNDKTRIGSISSKNFSAFEQSTLKQIEHVLLDRQRLIKRTQTKRSSYHILGEENEEPPLKKQAEESIQDVKAKSLQKEIFDDDDFYHQLLSELIKRKANDLTDPVQLGRQWTQLQKIRSKMKKTVDTKASKGRKVRFVVHPKLVNFMMPIDGGSYNEESRGELLNSLFGKCKK